MNPLNNQRLRGALDNLNRLVQRPPGTLNDLGDLGL